MSVKKSHAKSIVILAELIRFGEIPNEDLKVTCNINHNALGIDKQNCIWLRPRKTPGICHMEVKVGKENIDSVKEELDELAISYNLRKTIFSQFQLDKKI